MYVQKKNEQSQKERLALEVEQVMKMAKLEHQTLPSDASDFVNDDRLFDPHQVRAWFDLSGKFIASSNRQAFSSIIKKEKLTIESSYDVWIYQMKDSFYYFKKIRQGNRPVGILVLKEPKATLTKENKWFIGILFFLFSFLLGIIGYQEQKQKEKSQIPIREILPILQDFLAHPEEQKQLKNDVQEWQQVYQTMNELMQETSHLYYEQVINEERLKSILENLDVGILIKTETNEEICNSVAADLLFKQNELLNQVDSIAKELEEEKRELKKEIQLDFPYPKDLQVVAKGLKYEGGRLKEYLLIFYDITPIKKTERLHEDFIRNVSHELKTPITSIMGFSETLMEESLSREDEKRFLKIIHKESLRLADLIQNILLLSRDHERFDDEKDRNWETIGSIIQKEIDQYEASIRKQQIRIGLDISSQAYKTTFPREYFQPVVKNLLENAIQYSPKGSEIKIKSWIVEKQFYFSILDQGIGIPKAEQVRVFEKFYRVGNARDRKVGGTGLGLAIVQKYVHQLNGKIQLTSEENIGTYIVVELPIERMI